MVVKKKCRQKYKFFFEKIFVEFIFFILLLLQTFHKDDNELRNYAVIEKQLITKSFGGVSHNILNHQSCNCETKNCRYMRYRSVDLRFR